MFNELISYYLNCFQQQGEPALITICNLKVPSDIILSEYKKLPPLETLPDEQKKELWEYAKEKYPNGDKDTRIRFTKIVYTVGNLI